MAYARPSSYPYPSSFKNIKDVEEYQKKLYASLMENDRAGEFYRDRATPIDLTAIMVRPEWYGAKADGVTDDRAAIIAAHDHIKSTGGVVYYSPKTYRIASTATINVDAGARVVAYGPGATLYYGDAGATGTSMFYLSCAGEIVVDGIEFDGRYSTMADNTKLITAISGTEATVGVTIRNCYIHDWSCHGTYRTGEYSKILFNNIHECHYNGVDNGGDNYLLVMGNKITNSGYQGIDIDRGAASNNTYAPRHCRVIGNKVIGWGKSEVANTAGITLGSDEVETSYAGNNGWNEASDNYIEYVKYDENAKWGMVVCGRECVVSGNTIRSSTTDLMTYGIIIGNYSEGLAISGNAIRDCLYGIFNVGLASAAYHNRNLNISNNVVENSAYGILLNATSSGDTPTGNSILVSGNSVYATDYGIWVKGMDGSSVSGNSVKVYSAAAVSPYGITAESVTGCSFSGNNVEVETAAGSPVAPCPFVIDTGDALTSITNNTLSNKTSGAGYGAYIISLSGYFGHNTIYANTPIALSTSDSATGDYNHDAASVRYVGFDGGVLWYTAGGALLNQDVTTTASPTFADPIVTTLNVGANQVIGAQGAAVADATDAASVILRLNDLLSRCRAHGLIAT